MIRVDRTKHITIYIYVCIKRKDSGDTIAYYKWE